MEYILVLTFAVDGETGLGDKEVSALWTLVPDTCNKRTMVSIFNIPYRSREFHSSG
jgi:hypothetical protein